MRISPRLAAVTAALALAAGGLAACGDDDDDETAATPETTEQTAPPETEPTPAAEPEQSIIELAMSNPAASDLAAAVEQAGLVETLEGEGPFTVFAPSNVAFQEAGDVVGPLLEPGSEEQLADVLTYHVVPGEYTSADLQDGQELETVQGGTLTVGVDAGTVTVNDVPVEVPDVQATNGVVHVIGGVLVPEG